MTSKSLTPSLSEKERDETRIERVESNRDVAGPSTRKGDAALEILGDGSKRHQFTEEEDAAVLKKIDWRLMPVLLIVYTLQQLDKSSVSYASVFGLIEDNNLVGQQYSWLSSIVYVAQLIWQPVSSYLLVRFPLSKYLTVHVFLWGVIVASTAASSQFSHLIAARFFLGLFEATIAPCFITITQMWWRRREQTTRMSMWMAANGAASVLGSLLTYGLGHINGKLHPWQTIFLTLGLLTVVCTPIVYFVLPDSPTKAKFLSDNEKKTVIERLRANNQGTETKTWNWKHAAECFLDPKSYLFFLLLFTVTIPSGGIGSFGPLIISGFGFTPFETTLMKIPWAAIQVIITLLSGWVAQRIKLKWPVLTFMSVVPIAGVCSLYVLGRGPELRNTLLGCYYLIGIFTGLQPLLYGWASQNVAGHTKKVCLTGFVFVAQCAGNIVGPLMYRTQDKPRYDRGLISNLICFCALTILIWITALYLHFMNLRHAKRRVALGKPEKIVDASLERYKQNENGGDGEAALNTRAFDDLTDLENEDFSYCL